MGVAERVVWAGDHQEKGSKPKTMSWFPSDRKGRYGFEC